MNNRKQNTAAELKYSCDALIAHIIAMADDAYLVDHPEWVEIVNEARAIKETTTDSHARRSIKSLDDIWGRKLDDWNDAPRVTANDVELSGIPVFWSKKVYGRASLEGIVPGGTDFVVPNLPMVFILFEFDGERAFLIDTDGYNYARYVIGLT